MLMVMARLSWLRQPAPHAAATCTHTTQRTRRVARKVQDAAARRTSHTPARLLRAHSMHLAPTAPLMPLNLLGDVGKDEGACAAQQQHRADADDVGNYHDHAGAAEEGRVAAAEGADGLVP